MWNRRVAGAINDARGASGRLGIQLRMSQPPTRWGHGPHLLDYRASRLGEGKRLAQDARPSGRPSRALNPGPASTGVPRMKARLDKRPPPGRGHWLGLQRGRRGRGSGRSALVGLGGGWRDTPSGLEGLSWPCCCRGDGGGDLPGSLGGPGGGGTRRETDPTPQPPADPPLSPCSRHD